jgi:hypothetical protein
MKYGHNVVSRSKEVMSNQRRASHATTKACVNPRHSETSVKCSLLRAYCIQNMFLLAITVVGGNAHGERD